MLNRVEVANFKAWHKADITFGNITGFFGSNSAGKSSLLQLLLLLNKLGTPPTAKLYSISTALGAR